MRILVLSSVYPNTKQPQFGVFVQERIVRLARHCELVVVAPVAWFPFNRLFRGVRRSDVATFELQRGIRVYHPKFFSMPGVMKFLDGVFYFLSVLPMILRLRRQFPFDLIDAHFAYPDGMAAWLLGKLLHCPVTVTLRGTIVPLSKFRLRRRQIQWSLKGVPRVFSVSQSLKEVAVSLGVPPSKIRVIPNGVDPELFHPAGKQEARRLLDLPIDRTIVLSVGALAERKGHQRVLHALPDVVAKRSDLLYVVVGGPSPEGDTGPLLRGLIEQLGLREHVRLVGPRPHEEIPLWLAAADLFCLATSNEGRANVILEALACGVPVVATRIGANEEVVREGVNGLLVPLRNQDALSRALLRGTEIEWNHQVIAAEAKSHSWDQTVTTVTEELKKLVPQRAESATGLGPLPQAERLS